MIPRDENEEEIEQLVIQHFMNADSWNATTGVNTDLFEVEEILEEKMEDGFLMVRVKWKDYEETTWEPIPSVSRTKAYKSYVKKVRRKL